MIRVVVVDDSRTARKHLVSLFSGEEGFQVVAEAASGAEALRKIAEHAPDLVSLDVVLPDVSAADLVREVLSVHPVPIVLVSHMPRTSPEVFEALAAGALDLIRKPKVRSDPEGTRFLRIMRTLSGVPVRSPPKRASAARSVGVVCIGASTGGPGALRDFLVGLEPSFRAPIVVAQHVASGFEEALASWLEQSVGRPVRIASDGEPLAPGAVLLGRSGHDLRVVGDSVRITVAPAGGYHPSADALFQSAAAAFGSSATAVVLSGIGEDGALGAKWIVDAGGMVVAQDEHSSAVYGMPRAVASLASVIGPPALLAKSLVEARARAGWRAARSRSPG